MKIEDRIADVDRAGRAAPTLRASFGSQAEQGIFLRNMVREYSGRLPIRELAVGILREEGIPPKRKIAQAVALGSWAQRSLYYVNEGIETFSTPIRTIRSGFGDCDDFTTTIGALCESIGIPVELVLMGVNVEPGRYTHIFPRAVVRAPSGRIVRVPLDATLEAPIGFTDPIAVAVRRGASVRTLAV
jgi:transglutaminase-like putative cysteine protease